MRRALSASLLVMITISFGCSDDAATDTASTSSAAASSSSAASTSSASTGSGGGTGCALTADTTATATVTNGCALLERDVSACKAAREAAGLSGAWLSFSCRVALSVVAAGVQITTDSRPDYASNYFPKTDPCYEAYTTQFPDPNEIVAENIVVAVPSSPSGNGRPMAGLGVVGVAVNGVSLFSNTAAPGDDIYTEAFSFDQCQGHPNTIAYHYHTEPYSISSGDAALIGVMRDGYFVYGRKDADGSTPTLDANGGHTSATADSATPVYHYHVNEQTSSNEQTKGMTAWFLTTGTFQSAPGVCTGCGDMM